MEAAMHKIWTYFWLPETKYVIGVVAFLALLSAAGFRAAPGALMVPLHDEFGWSTSVMSLAVSINLVLYGLTAPFAAARRIGPTVPRGPRSVGRCTCGCSRT